MSLTKILIGTILIFAGTSAMAAGSTGALAWSDVSQVGSTYTLTQDLIVGPGVVFSAKQGFEFLNATSGGGDVPVVALELVAKSCSFPDKVVSDMALILPVGSSPDSSVGVEMYKQCHLVVYVEDQDVVSPSFFAEGPK